MAKDAMTVRQVDEFDHSVSVGGRKIGKVFAWGHSGYGAKLTRGMSMSPKFETVDAAAIWLVDQSVQWQSDKAVLTKSIKRGGR